MPGPRLPGPGLPGPGNSEALGPRDREGKTPDEFDPVRQLEKQVAAGRLRLTLRAVEEEHAALDRKAEANEREQKRETERQLEARREAERPTLARDQERGPLSYPLMSTICNRA